MSVTDDRAQRPWVTWVVMAAIAIVSLYATVTWIQCDLYCYNLGRFATFNTEGSCYCLPPPPPNALEEVAP